MASDLIKSSIKLALSLILAVLGTALVGALTMALYKGYQKSRAAPFSETKEWQDDLTVTLGVTVTARTKWLDDQILAQVEITGYPKSLSAPANAERAFILNFADKDGFIVYTKEATISAFTGIVDSSRKRIGLRMQFSDAMRLDEYKSLAALNVAWNIDPTATSAPEASLSPARQPRDPCAPGITKRERLARLGDYGEVRQVGGDEYRAGSHRVSFFYDGTLLSCY